jgi:hypothetical protein
MFFYSTYDVSHNEVALIYLPVIIEVEYIFKYKF